MRIIEKGKIPEEIEHTTTCGNCKTKFAFMAKEARFQADQRDGDFYQIDCPVCKKIISVDASFFRHKH